MPDTSWFPRREPLMGTIATRLFLSYLAVIAVGLLVAAVAVGGLLLRYENDLTRVRLEELSAPLATSVQAALRQGRQMRDAVQAVTDQARSVDARVLVIASNTRRVIVDTDGSLEGQTLPSVDPGRGVGTFREKDVEWSFVQRQIAQAGTMVVARPRAVFADTLRALSPSLVTSGVIAALFALIVAGLLARTITDPIRALAGSARTLVPSHYRTRAPVTGPNEVRELAGAFNDMADEVARARGSEQAFLADMSHELRTPLTAIHGFAQAIVEEEVKGEGVAWAASVVQREARRLVRMVEGLLQVAKLESGAHGMAREQVDVGELLGGAITALAPQAREANVAIDQALSPLPPLRGDPDRLSQLFLNVLDNALKHSPAGSTVAVRAAREDGEIVVRVRDEGSGLPDGAESRLFERFYRGENAASREGTGLGLAIAQAIAQAHAGHIDARNVAGHGAEFVVHLPLR